ncbi:hypothetical protein AB840_08135 [Megasphaera cerevisiae DSM 20462]|uniref:Transglycosylase SLT domain-containing protein n=1 Tax=Megasphaera cerevisiae DSM 20462 TaxID=1122219 RepID=A0A0J6WSD5_9FIRM|nr:transglycosylase SLT domain-containing protein [Megasphaera cerevisiae]KMO86425.1 hypothetical protein AB840_08135 [Megasphaera cerevisiae DSM 20462]SJZ72579.1 Membrane protein involved in colicin uptake [Megasphaera cerevisiae DSM 20462]
MAANDVQINIIGKDQATGAFQSVLQSAEKTSRGVQGLGTGVGSLNTSFRDAQSSALSFDSVLASAGGYAMAIAGVQGLGEALHATVGEAIDFYTTMQTGSISLAGSLISMGQLNGQDLTWNQSLLMSKKLMSDLSDQALVTGASTKEISDVFRGMIPNALNAGMTLDQTLKLAGTLTTTGKAMGLNGNILMRDVQDLISGKNVERTKLGALLGITGEDIAQAKQSAGGLFDFLSKRLQGEMQANQKYLESFEGRWNHLKESIARVGGVGLDTTFKAATDEMAAIANQFVKVNNETHQVEFVNPDMIEKVQAAGQVVMNFGGQVKEFANDIKGIAIPALTGLGVGIDFVSQHAAIMGEVLIGTWVARKLNTYVVDYQNAIHGAAEAQTFLGRAVIDTRNKVMEETAAMQAQRAAYLQKAQESMASIAVASTPVYGNTKNIANEIALEAQLGRQVTNTAAAEAGKMVAINTARNAFEGANAALLAGERELAIKILESNTTMEARGIAAGTMSARATQAIQLIQMGETELAQKILVTNAALDWQGNAAVSSAAKVTEGATAGKLAQAELAAVTNTTTGATIGAGIQAETMGNKMVTAGNVAKTAVGKLGTAIFALSGGWIGVAIATTLAAVELDKYMSRLKDYNKNHTFQGIDGKYYTYTQDGQVAPAMDPNGSIFGDGHGNGYATWNPGASGMGAAGPTDIPGDDVKQSILDQELAYEEQKHQEEIQKAADEQKQQQEKWLEIQKNLANDPQYQKTQQEIEDMMRQVTGKYDGEGSGKKTAAEKAAEKAAKEAAHQAQQIAEANHQYAETIKQNAQKIQQANEKIAGILASEDEKLLQYNGTQLDIDLAKNKKDWMDLAKQIHGAAVNLKTLSFSTASHTTMGGGLGAQLYSLAASKDGMPYLLGGDGISATDCGKLFVDGVAQATGVTIGRTVDNIEDYAKSNGAWHPAGDGYVPQVGDGVVVLDGGHIVMSNGRGGYVGANSSTGVVEKDSVTDDFGQPVGYVSVSQLFPNYDNSSAPVQPSISQDTAMLQGQSPEVQALVHAAQETSSDIGLILAIAMRESGGDTLSGINMAPNGGMMQVTEQSASDYGINDIYPQWRDDMEQNALAGIYILSHKIAEQGGDVWAGVKAYNGSGPAADEYESQVQGNYNSLGADDAINLAPTSFTRYAPPGTQEGLDKNNRIKTLADQKAYQDWAIRYRKQQEETSVMMNNLELTDAPDGREAAIQTQGQAEINANNDKWKDYYKASGDEQASRAYLNALNLKSVDETNTKLRDNRSAEYDEQKQHLTSLGYLQRSYQRDIDEQQQAALQNFISTQKQELAEMQLTTAEKTKLEQSLYENQKSLDTLMAKTSWSGGLASLQQEMRSYSQDIGSAMTEGWNNITGSMEGAFSNLLTENKSFAERMKNLYISIGNEILNTTMKIIMQGLIMNSVMKAMGSGTSFNFGSVLSSMGISGNVGGTSLGLDTEWSSGLSMVGSFASGGTVPSGYALVGENGAELIYNKTPGYVYNARETSDILGKVANGQDAGSSSGAHSVNMTLVNKSGQNLQVSNPSVSFNGTKLVASAVIDIVKNNRYGVRTMLKGMV